MGADLYPVKVDRGVRVPMDDGIEIALTIYLPDAAGDGPFPAVVESVPYRKDDDCFARDLITFEYLAQRGFAGIRIDIRGTGASDGIIENEYVAREQLDTVAVMRWAAAQDWCTGRLGMWGISWGGFSALQTAMLRPPELHAIVPVHATHDRFACDVHYYGGALHLLEQVDWPVGMVALNALPPDPDIVGEPWLERWRERLRDTPQWLPTWLRHQQRDDYWLQGSPCRDYASIDAPTLLIGGWLDGYVDGMLEMLEALHCPKQAIIGPWGHSRPASGEPGPTFDHLRAMERWFGHWLRGDDNGVPADPLLSVFIRTSPPYDPVEGETAGYWRAEPAWPPRDREWRVLALDHDLIGPETDSAWAGPLTVGSSAPGWDTAMWGSGDTSDDDESCLVFESEPLQAPIEILGPPRAELSVTVDAPYGQVAVRLINVTPTGEASLVARGLLNLSHRNGLGDPALVQAGEGMSVSIPLRMTSAVVAEGHRLRLAISGADFPLAWPPPGPVTLTIDPTRSSLILPLVPGRPEETTLELPVAPARTSPVQTQEDVHDLIVESRGTKTTLRRTVADRQLQPARNHLVYANRQDIQLDVDAVDPLATRAWARAVTSLERGDWKVATTGQVEITSDADAFYLVIDLEARSGDEVVHRHHWEEVVPRTWV